MWSQLDDCGSKSQSELHGFKDRLNFGEVIRLGYSKSFYEYKAARLQHELSTYLAYITQSFAISSSGNSLFWISKNIRCFISYDPFHIKPIYCHFSWALSYSLLDNRFESLFHVSYNFLSTQNTCVGKHLAHSRHWQIGMQDAEVYLSRT